MKLDIDDAENFRGDVKVVAIEDLRAFLTSKQASGKPYSTKELLASLGKEARK